MLGKTWQGKKFKRRDYFSTSPDTFERPPNEKHHDTFANCQAK